MDAVRSQAEPDWPANTPRPDVAPPVGSALDGFSLPGWIYHDGEFLAAERQRVFSTSWQVVCHLNDIPRRGGYHTLDFLGDPPVAVRGEDGGVRAFFNVCRHRASRLLDDGKGRCPCRRMHAARYLNWRINRRVSAEDKGLIERVQSGMASRSYSPGHLGRNEVSLRSFAQRLRRFIPTSRLERPAAPGWSRALGDPNLPDTPNTPRTPGMQSRVTEHPLD